MELTGALITANAIRWALAPEAPWWIGGVALFITASYVKSQIKEIYDKIRK